MIIKGQNPGAVFDCGNLSISPSSVQAESNKYTSIDFTTNYNIDSIYGTFIDPQGNPFVSVPLSLVSDKTWKVNFTFDKIGIWKIELNITKDGGICKKVITVEVKNPNDCTNCTLDTLSQYENDCTTLIPPGGMITLKSVCLRGSVKKCPDNFQVQFEVTQVSDIFFQNAYSKLGATLSQEVSANFSNLANGQYHWRARVLKPDGTPCSAWLHYGNNVNGAPDFIIGDSPCNMDTSNIPSQIACINIGDYSVDINGYNPQNCTITVTSDRTDVIIARNSTKQNSFGRFFVYIESVNVCGTANITISVTGCVNCTKTVAISVTGQCCGQSSELFVDPVNATMCVGEKRQFYIKSTTGISFTDEHWSSSSPCLKEVQGKPGMFEAVCAGGPFQIFASVMTDNGKKEAKPASVTIIASPSVTITPPNITITNCDPVQFIATTNPSGLPVTWSVEPSSLGTITNNGLFTPAKNNGTMSGLVIAKVGVGNCTDEGHANIVVNCPNYDLVIEPINTIKDCNHPIQLKAYLKPGDIPCNPIWKMDCQPSDLATIDAVTGLVIPKLNAKGTCTVTATCNNLVATTTITFDCILDCINLWISRPTPLMPTNNPGFSANQICKCIPYQFKAFCIKSDYTGPHDVSAEGQWSIVPPVAGVTIDSNGKLISAVTGTFVVIFKRQGVTAQYAITVVDCNICPPIGIYFPCDLVFIIGIPFPIMPILYRADGSTVAQDPDKPFKYVIGDPAVIMQQGNENKFVGLKPGRTTIDVYYESLHTKTVIIINPPSNDNCASGAIIAPPSSPVPIDPMLRPIPSYWYYRCCPIVFSSVFRDRNGRLIDCSLARWEVIALDVNNNGSFVMNNGSFVANRSGWYIIIVNCCDLTLVICIFIVDVYCEPVIPCQLEFDKPSISKDFSDKCCPDGDTTNNTPLDRYEETVKVTKNDDSLVTIDSNAYWLKTEPTSFTERSREIKVFIDPKYFAKGSGGTCHLIFKCGDRKIPFPVTIKTKAEIYATVQAFQLKQKTTQTTPITLKQELTDSEIAQQLKLAPNSYRVANSCNASFDMIQKYGVIPFQMWLNKGTVPPGYDGNRTFLPLRFFADVGCLNVSWDNNKKEATIEGYGRKIVIGLKEEQTIRYAFISGSTQPTPNPQEPRNVKGLVRIINGRVMVGAKFVFDEFRSTITLNTKDHATVDIIFRPGWDYPTCITQMFVNPNSILVDLISGLRYS